MSTENKKIVSKQEHLHNFRFFSFIFAGDTFLIHFIVILEINTKSFYN